MRYVDDSNQLVKSPPAGWKYNSVSEKIVYDEIEAVLRRNEKPDKRVARLLTEIANSVQEGIVMEEDHPSNNDDLKLPILDLKVWMDSEQFIVFQHYEKAVASGRVMHAKSAQSATCKKSVHVQEILRRILNFSDRLEWQTDIVPVITEYMRRMMVGGYKEGYRRNVLCHALRIYDKMVRENETGDRPMYRPRDWQREERIIDKKKKKHDWSTKGGHIAPIIVPATPNSELANALRKVAEQEGEQGLKFKVVEGGGRTIKSIAQKSNPTATPGCGQPDCLACAGGRGEGGNCLKSNVQYSIRCGTCPDEAPTVYLGETSRNLYTRAKEHQQKRKSKSADSFMASHQAEKHKGERVNFKAKVEKSFQDCLTRQISEGVYIRRSEVPLMNTKSEWHQPSLWQVQSEIHRG